MMAQTTAARTRYAKNSRPAIAAPNTTCAPSDRRGYRILARQKPAPPAPANKASSGSVPVGANGCRAAGSNEVIWPAKPRASPAATGPPRNNTQNHTFSPRCSCGVSGISSGSGGSSGTSYALHDFPQSGHQLGSGAPGGNRWPQFKQDVGEAIIGIPAKLRKRCSRSFGSQSAEIDPPSTQRAADATKHRADGKQHGCKYDGHEHLKRPRASREQAARQPDAAEQRRGSATQTEHDALRIGGTGHQRHDHRGRQQRGEKNPPSPRSAPRRWDRIQGWRHSVIHKSDDLRSDGRLPHWRSPAWKDMRLTVDKVKPLLGAPASCRRVAWL